jgi:hypothetical protein
MKLWVSKFNKLMKKTSLLKAGLTFSLVILFSSVSFAQKQDVKLKNADANMVVVNGRKLAKVGKAPVSGTKTQYSAKLSTSRKKNWSDGNTEADILIDEDFSAFTAGTEDNPDTTLLASYTDAPGMYINNSFTKQDTWSGNFVYSAGGKIALISPNEYTPGDLNTPLGDYSGDLTITFKVKALESCDLFVNVLRGGYAACNNVVVKDGSCTQDYRIYPKNGWKLVTLKVSNLSADNDGFIEFHNYGSLIIDDFMVTATPDFVAAPKMLPITNCTGTGFTANWEPVRLAFNYYIDLYKKVYTSAGDTTLTLNFENAKEDGSGIPSDWIITNKGKLNIGETAGADSTKGLILTNGSTLTTPYDYSKYKDIKLWMHIYDPNPDVETNENIANITISMYLKTANGWERHGDIIPDGFLVGRDFDLGEYFSAYSYYAVRFVVSGLPDGDYVAFDNISATTGRSAKLEEVEGDFPPYFYATTKDTSYTFENLDPQSDYYYSVRSHYLLMYSDRNPLFAFGLSVPTPTKATDITSSSYTANWNESLKASYYRVYNYGINNIKADESDHVILSENFSKIDASVTTADDPYNPEAVGNESFVGLDEYTAMPGWGGIGLTLNKGMVGAEAYESNVNYVRTPMFYVNNADNFGIKIKAYGVTGDNLIISTNGKEYAVPFTGATSAEDENGVIDETYTIPERSAHEIIYFYSYNKYAFMLDNVEITQDVKAGNVIYDYLGYKQLSSDSLSYAFTGLDKYSYDKYAFTTRAFREFEGDTTASDMSDYFYVESTTTGLSNVNKADANATVVARYAVDGTRLDAPRKGVNIVKMSNGKVYKVIIK